MKKCRLPKKPSKTSSITFDAKFMTEVLKRVDSVTKFSDSADSLTHSHLIVTYQGDVFVVGRTPDTFVCHAVLGASSDSDTAFNIDPQHLLGLINKRQELVMNYEYPQVAMSEVKGKYRSEFKVKQLSPEQIPMVEEGLRHHISGGHEMGREVIDQMTMGVRATRIKDVITDDSVVCRVICDGKSMKVLSPGDWTSSQYVSKLKKKCEPFRFSLTGEMFDLVSKFCGDEKVTFHVDTSSFTAEAESFVMSLPPIQSSDEDYRYVDIMLKDIGDPVYSVELEGDLTVPFTNISALLSKQGNFNASLVLKKKDFRLHFGNDSGSVSDVLKLRKAVDKEFKVLLDMRIMQVLLKNVGKETEHKMSFHGASLNDLSAFTLRYKNDQRDLIYFGYVPA